MAQASAQPKKTTAKAKKPSANKSGDSIKKRLENLSVTVIKAEKNAEKQIQKILQATDQYRKDQMKKVHELIAEAKKLKSSDLLKRAHQMRSEIEKTAQTGFKTLLKNLSIPSQADIEKLKARITHLEDQLKKKN
jgi:polyhydroxyalkanoate synthesis regulator phasin